MNKTLMISLVAALGVAGGGYMLMGSEKNYSKYIPEPVAELIGDYLPENFQVQQPEVAVNELEVYQENVFVEDSMVVTEEYAQEVEQGMGQIEPAMRRTDAVVAEQFYYSEPDQEVVDTQQPIVDNSGYSESPQTKQVPVHNLNNQNVNVQTEVLNINQGNNIEETVDRSDESVVGVAMNEIQEKLSESLEPVTSGSNDPQAVSMVNQINATASEISRLDLENKALEDKFQKILRKNRERAKQLAEIDSQLAQLAQLN